MTRSTSLGSLRYFGSFYIITSYASYFSYLFNNITKCSEGYHSKNRSRFLILFSQSISFLTLSLIILPSSILFPSSISRLIADSVSLLPPFRVVFPTFLGFFPLPYRSSVLLVFRLVFSSSSLSLVCSSFLLFGFFIIFSNGFYSPLYGTTKRQRRDSRHQPSPDISIFSIPNS